jgi:hypothetical protein
LIREANSLAVAPFMTSSARPVTLSKWQNGPVERQHQTPADGMRSMLHGAGLGPEFWPYAFYHFIRLTNMTPHARSDKSPHELRTGSQPDFSLLRTFGCRVYVKPPSPHPAKLAIHSNMGVFLGYSKTMQNIFYYDLSTKEVKLTTNAQFDEGMNDLATLPPNTEYLLRSHGTALPPDDSAIPALDLEITTNPFSILCTETVDISCDHPTFWFRINDVFSPETCCDCEYPAPYHRFQHSQRRSPISRCLHCRH